MTVSKSLVAVAVIYISVFYNTLLAFVNGNIFALNNAVVVLCDALCVALALALILFKKSLIGNQWMKILLICLVLHLVACLVSLDFNVKFVRDILIIPIFIILGSVYCHLNLKRIVIGISAVVVFMGVWEAVSVDSFTSLFNIKSYYINTRGFSAENFWNQDSNLFVSGTRPGDRFVPLFDIHRVSSAFLEPVSLGNFAVFLVIFIPAFWRENNGKGNYFLVFAAISTLALCDGRLAIITSVLFLFFLLFERIVRPFRVYLLWIIFVPAILFSLALGWSPTEDNFTGRIAKTAYKLSDLNIFDLILGNITVAPRLFDSGVLYFVLSQSLISVLILWAALFSTKNKGDRCFNYYVLGLGLYLSFSMLISYSFLSIKTAALFYFTYGYLLERALRKRYVNEQTA
ncbi:MAG: hypothetical protein ACW7DQ_09825 [Paraglaciecola chathamensis]|uniref:hypothetical protein n=1 Tax=Neptunomonas phycophila TaxID=1572645 RepID=UPI001BE5EE0D|nr:hypothetical protein [Neptunomonas phycophila]MBT3144133.1 hypothetical protein [Neptunomonas phycophila]